MKTLLLALLFLLSIVFVQCTKEDSPGIKNSPLEIPLKNSGTYQYDFHISGDEEGAVIIQQAQHAVKSEIIRNETTNWSVVYVYQPEDDFTGIDSVKIETCTGGDGSINSCVTDTVQLIFHIEN